VLYKWLPIARPEDYRDLATSLSTAFAPHEVAAFLQANASIRCTGVLLEFAYVDKDYRSTYYHFYAKKGLRYSSHCVRLHFFAGEMDFREDTLELTTQQGDLQSHYLGFMVLRPTWIATIGRTVASTWLMNDFRGHMIGGDYKVHILGNKLSVWGFPWMYQHRDIQVCAHVACWAILRHYSERYGSYAERLTHDVTRMAYAFDPGGLLPSKGLTLEHAERVFAAAGTYPIVVSKTPKDSGQFYQDLLAYVESGFPIFAALFGQKHAIAIIGRGVTRNTLGANQETLPLYFSADFTDELIAVDDNLPPYVRIGKAPAQAGYGIDAIGAFIVPLPDKIHYPAEAVSKYALLLAEKGFYGVGIGIDETPVIRYFLTTAASYTRFIVSNRSQFTQPLLSAALQLPLTQYVWVIEVSTQEQWEHNQIEFRAVLDATASLVENDPLFLIHNNKRVVYINRAAAASPRERDFDPIPGAILTPMPGNLKQSHPLAIPTTPGATHA
jgi:hypothetical protein